MSKMSRRAAMGTMTATVMAGLGSKAVADQPTKQQPDGPVKPMTLEEFKQMNTPEATEDLFKHVEGHTFSMCHKQMAEEQGIWIPELVPVFEKLDQMRAAQP